MELLRNPTAEPGVVVKFDAEQTIEQARAQEREARGRIADADRRIQRAWGLAEEGAMEAAQLQMRVQLEDRRRRAEAPLAEASAFVTRAATESRSSETIAELLENLPILWLHVSAQNQKC